MKCPTCKIPLVADKKDPYLGTCSICGSNHAISGHIGDERDFIVPSVSVVEIGRFKYMPKWKWILSYLGIPVKEGKYTPTFPWIGAIFVSLCICVYILGSKYVELLMYTPDRSLSGMNLNLFSYSITHSSWLHLGKNILFLCTFMDSVEEHLGHLKMLILILFSAAMAATTHIAFSTSNLPLVGASGVCFAVAALYCLLYPRNRFLIGLPGIGFLVPKLRLRIKAWLLFFAFIIIELSGLVKQMNVGTSVSHLGHIGGATVGLAAWIFWRPQPNCVKLPI